MKRLTFLLAALMALALSSPSALAWPDKPVRLIVGFQAGGSTDVIARLLADRLREQWGTSVIVENRPGANGQIAATVMLNAHDGHTLLIGGDNYTVAPYLSKAPSVKPLVDFKMISILCEGTLILLAAPDAPFRTFPEMVAYARANPGKLSYVSSGVGNPQHLVGEYLAGALKLDMVHIPSRGGGQAVTDLVGGQMPMGILGLGPTIGYVKAGKLRPLAITAEKRLPQLPDVPTLGELGVANFTVAQWFGLLGPPDMPDAVARQVSQAVAKALDDAMVRQRLEEIGFTAIGSTPEQLRARLVHDEAMWKKIIEERGIRID